MKILFKCSSVSNKEICDNIAIKKWTTYQFCEIREDFVDPVVFEINDKNSDLFKIGKIYEIEIRSA